MNDPSVAYTAKALLDNSQNGKEPILGGQLRERAVWVDESRCIGCRYCSNVASNTFFMEDIHGRARVMRQDGDSLDRIKEAIETCPVNCIHWVRFEELEDLRAQIDSMELQNLGMLPKVSRRIRIPKD